jgi:hypothetical protein
MGRPWRSRTAVSAAARRRDGRGDPDSRGASPRFEPAAPARISEGRQVHPEGIRHTARTPWHRSTPDSWNTRSSRRSVRRSYRTAGSSGTCRSESRRHTYGRGRYEFRGRCSDRRQRGRRRGPDAGRGVLRARGPAAALRRPVLLTILSRRSDSPTRSLHRIHPDHHTTCRTTHPLLSPRAPTPSRDGARTPWGTRTALDVPWTDRRCPWSQPRPWT